jgi:hypothetical protein
MIVNDSYLTVVFCYFEVELGMVGRHFKYHYAQRKENINWNHWKYCRL